MSQMLAVLWSKVRRKVLEKSCELRNLKEKPACQFQGQRAKYPKRETHGNWKQKSQSQGFFSFKVSSEIHSTNKSTEQGRHYRMAGMRAPTSIRRSVQGSVEAIAVVICRGRRKHSSHQRVGSFQESGAAGPCQWCCENPASLHAVCICAMRAHRAQR